MTSAKQILTVLLNKACALKYYDMRFIINALKGHMYQLISFLSSIYVIIWLFFSTHILSAILTLRMMSYICMIVSY